MLFTTTAPDQAKIFFSAVQSWIIGTAGWFYILAVAIFVIFVVLLAISDYGRIKLGPDHSEPDYSYGSWFAMLFSAGMGIGLMFYGVAEPVMHYLSPPSADPGTVQAARDAMRITFFHWGVHAWAIYAVVALALAYFSFRQDLPLTIRSALYPLIGEKIHGPIGHAVDTFAVLGTLFGVATSLGLGVIQVNAGLNYLLDVPVTTSTQVMLIAVLLVITFFVTSSDSGSLVVDMLTSEGNGEDTPVWQRIFWAVAEGAIAATLLLAGGLVALQTATIASALPFTIVMLFVCWGLFKALRLEVVKRRRLRDAMHAPRVAGNPVSWEQRLSRIIHQPSKQQVLDYIGEKVQPALEKVAEHFRERNIEARVAIEEGKRSWIEVLHGEEIDFFYSVHARPMSPPSFTMRDTRKQREEKLKYCRTEVYLEEGGQDYDVMGWSSEQIIADVIDQYEKHLYYLDAIR